MSTPDEDIRIYIERLKVTLGVRSDEQLADQLGYSKQTIASWRKRGRLPAEAERRIVDAYGPYLAHSPELRYVAQRREDETVYAAALFAYERFVKSLDHAPDLQLRQALGYWFPRLVEAVRRGVRSTGFEQENSESMIEVLTAVIAADALPEVSEILERLRPKPHR